MENITTRQENRGAEKDVHDIRDSLNGGRNTTQKPSTAIGEPSTGVDVGYTSHNINENKLLNPIETPETITDWLEHRFTPVRDVRSEGKPVLAPLESAYALSISALQALRDVHNKDASWSDIISNLDTHTTQMHNDSERLAQNRSRSFGDHELLQAIQEYMQIVKTIMTEAESCIRTARERTGLHIARFGSTQIDKEQIPHLLRMEDTAYQRYRVAIDNALSSQIATFDAFFDQLRGEVQDTVTQHLRDEYRGPGFAMSLAYGTELELCEPGTRVDILARISEWSDDVDCSQQVFWLNDAAGTGKSTIAATMARYWQGQSRLGGRFFFSPNVARNQEIRHFCRTVAADIQLNHPQLASTIESVLNLDPEASMEFSVQFIQLILDPLRRLKHVAGLFLVIDALDNCEPKSRQRLLNVILKELPKAPHVKVLLTSRPLTDIRDRLQLPDFVHDAHLLDINNPSHDDIALYVHAKLNRQLNIQERERIIQYSGGLFIWAATFCRAFRRSDLAVRLLENFSHSQVADPLDALYLEVLHQALVDKRAEDDFQKVLQVVVSVFQPISINTISALFPKVDTVNDFVQDLAAVFKDGHPDRPIKVLHPTFREFIASNELRANGFLVQMEPSHSMLAIACLDMLSETLRYDILELNSGFGILPRNDEVADLDDRIARKTSPAFRYATSYWAYHVSASDEAWYDWQRVTLFLREHYLHWMEFMGWQGTLSHGIRGLAHLGRRVKREISRGALISLDDILTVLHASHFLLRFQDMIQAAALHVYTIPPGLIPSSSPLAKSIRTKNRSPTVGMIGAERLEWTIDAKPLALPIEITHILFSPDASRVVTSGDHGYLRLWDAETGVLIPTAFTAVNRSRGLVLAVEFSLDGQYLAIATDSMEVHLLEVSSGDTIWRNKTRLGDIQLRIAAICFLPDEPYLAVVLHCERFDRFFKSYVIFYHVASGERSTKAVGLSGFVDRFRVCPNGTRAVYTVRRNRVLDYVYLVDLVSYDGFDDSDDYGGCIKVADFQLEPTLERVIDISVDGTRSVIYDPNGRTPLILLDCNTGKAIIMVDPDEPPSPCVVFVPQGNLMATVSPQGFGILLRDKQNGRVIKRICTSTRFEKIWISPDSQRLASHSVDKRIKVWNVGTGTELPSFFTGYTNAQTIDISPNWCRIVCSTDLEASIYDLTPTVTGLKTRPLKYARSGEYVAKMSMLILRTHNPGGLTVLSAWSTLTGTLQLIATFGEFSDQSLITCVTPDSQEILCWSTQEDISICSLVTYRREPLSLQNVRGTPHAEKGTIQFSLDGSFFALLVVDTHVDLIQIWEYKTGNHILDTRHSKDTVNSYTISDTHLAVFISVKMNRYAPSVAGEIKIYRISDGKRTAFQSGLDANIMVFSHRSDLIAIADRNSLYGSAILQVWSLETSPAKLIGEAKSYGGSEHPLGFSSDSKLVVYGSQVWELTPNGLQSFQSLTTPKSLLHYPHSFLSYTNGWIHTAFPAGPIVPIPTDLHSLFTRGGKRLQKWAANGSTILVWTTKREPIIFDFSEFMSR
ncbi:hypothetical protein PIIN_05667 [Serendipita indica DSM 11827]|uniref:Nephrocystin 3-like N-terminal domain-containing protein n=1 Tax=Serendipita indica (strain DSM 11827) TaxID=1109443 RepID=G4TK86_SERID|nr:hypothetical protein PIIN_05667 [Serendipita indica DSM 11827]